MPCEHFEPPTSAEGFELLDRELVPLIPQRNANLTRFHGVFAPTSSLCQVERANFGVGYCGGASVVVAVADGAAV